jgi:hypothetical protein
VGEACFSGASIALLAVVTAPLVAAFGILYRDGITSRNAQIADLIGQRNDLLKQVQGSNSTLDETKSAVWEHVDRKRRS